VEPLGGLGLLGGLAAGFEEVFGQRREPGAGDFGGEGAGFLELLEAREPAGGEVLGAEQIDLADEGEGGAAAVLGHVAGEGVGCRQALFLEEFEADVEVADDGGGVEGGLEGAAQGAGLFGGQEVREGAEGGGEAADGDAEVVDGVDGGLGLVARHFGVDAEHEAAEGFAGMLGEGGL